MPKKKSPKNKSGSGVESVATKNTKSANSPAATADSPPTSPPSSDPSLVENWNVVLPENHVGDIVYFDAGRAFQQFSFHSRQADKFFEAAGFLEDDENDGWGPADEIRKLSGELELLGKAEFAISSKIVEKIIPMVNRFPFSYEKKEKLRVDMVSLWQSQFQPKRRVEVITTVDEEGFSETFETLTLVAKLRTLRGALCGDCSRKQRLLFRAGEVLEAGRCPNDIAKLLGPAADERRWPTDSPSNADKTQGVRMQLGVASGKAGKDKTSSGKPSKKTVFSLVQRKVGELKPADGWWLNLDNILHSLKTLPALGSLPVLQAHMPTSRQKLNDLLNLICSTIVGHLTADGGREKAKTPSLSNERPWSPTEFARNEWIYQHYMIGLSLADVVEKLKVEVSRQTQAEKDPWKEVGLTRILPIAREFAERFDKPVPQPRKPGRPKKLES